MSTDQPPITPTLSHTSDRRQHPRQAAPDVYLRVDGRSARLVDWSLGGLGIRFDAPPASLTIGTQVGIDVLRRDGETWSKLLGLVRRIELRDPVIGVELLDTEETTPVLMELFHARLSTVRLPD